MQNEGVSFWLADHPRPADLVSDQAQEQADVVIVGAGLTGLSAGLVLARAGVHVCIFESGRVGNGASGRNGGFCTIGTTATFGAMKQRYGEATAQGFWAMARSSVDATAKVLAEEGIESEFERCGRVRLATKPGEAKKLEREAHVLSQDLGYECEYLPPDATREVIGYGRFHGGLLDRGSACLHPIKALFGLARSARRYGAAIAEQTAVHAVRRIGASRFEVSHARGHIRAQAVIVATDGYTGPLVRALHRRIIPIGSYIIVTERLSRHEREQLNPQRRIFATASNMMNYFRVTSDGRLLFGGRNSLSVDQDDLQSRRQLTKRFRALFPELRHLRVDYSWGGRIGFTFDRMPHVGCMEGIHYALGYCGHGVPTAIWCGQIVADLVMGRSTATPFDRISYPPLPFYNGKPWFIPLVGIWYRLKDVMAW
jgi:glycine/D-amino acid oxidase-like deaminating enzyme